MLFSSQLYACKEASDTSEVELLNLTEGFDDYYKTQNLVCWQDIAAVYSSKYTLNSYNYNNALANTETITDKAGYVISVSLLKRQGNDLSVYNIDAFITELKTAIESNYAILTLKELAMCIFAMTASDTDCSYESAAKKLEALQNEDGGFPVSSEYTYSDVESSAYALSVIMLSRIYISDVCYNNVLRYLGNRINEDNTLSDIENKKCAFTTALTLNSLISANVAMNGEIATALTKAINTDFKVENNSFLLGFKKYTEDTDVNREVTGEVFFCFAATSYGNLWINLAQEDNAE